MVSRFKQWAVTGLALSVIPAGIMAASWNIPGNFAHIQTAISSASVHDGDLLNILSALNNEPSINVTKGLTITGGNPARIDVRVLASTVASIQVSASGVSFSNLRIYNSDGKDLIKVKNGSNRPVFSNCYFWGSDRTSNTIFNSSGSQGYRLENCRVSAAGVGINSFNDAQVDCYQCEFVNLYKGVQFATNTANDCWYAFDNGSITCKSSTSGYCLKTSFPNKEPGLNVVDLTYNSLAAYGTGSLPCVVNRGTVIYIEGNTFNYCPTGKAWSRTFNDRIYGHIPNIFPPNSAPNGGTCQNGN
jgi:hypothetical protein